MNDRQKIYRYFLPTLKKYKTLAFLSVFLFTVFALVSNLITPLFYKEIVDVASIQFANQQFNFSELSTVMISVALVLFASYVSSRLASYFWTLFVNGARTHIHKESFKILTSKSYDFFTNNFVGTLTGKAGRLGNNFTNLFETIFFGFFLLLVQIVVAVAILMSHNTLLGLLFTGFIILFVGFSFIFVKKQGRLSRSRAEQSSRVKGVLSDILTNIFNTKIFSSFKRETDYFHNNVDLLHGRRLKSHFYQDLIRIYKSIFFFIIEVSVMFMAIYLFTQQKISLGVLVLVQSYLMNILRNAWNLDKSLSSFVEAFSDTSDAIDVITAPVTVRDIENPESVGVRKGALGFNTISFTYPDGDHVFEGFNLDILAGQSVGIVGKSGSGKTTITKLLLRLYDIDGGIITIDGQDISKITQHDLRTNIAYIPQETILFHRTIFENIAYGNPDASREEVIAAAKAAHVDEFVQNLEHGYETKVGERGVKLSGGQRQRVGIARAMLKSAAPILVLDEATSSLDSKSEKYIQDSFETLSQNRTTVVIAHRLSTIRKLDRIIVMERGQIIEDGSHLELIRAGGHYAELWNSQTNGFMNDENEMAD